MALPLSLSAFVPISDDDCLGLLKSKLAKVRCVDYVNVKMIYNQRGEENEKN